MGGKRRKMQGEEREGGRGGKGDERNGGGMKRNVREREGRGK